MLKQTHFHRRQYWSGLWTDCTHSTHKEVSSHDLWASCNGFNKFPASQLELHHPLSSSPRNSMAITLYQLESQPICTHPHTVKPFSTDPSSTSEIKWQVILFPPLSCWVCKIFMKTCLWLLYEIHVLNWRNNVFFLRSFVLLLFWNRATHSESRMHFMKGVFIWKISSLNHPPIW